MSVLQNFEKRLENLVEGAFARVFKGVVHPVEIAGAMQREADTHKSLLGGNRTLVPNRYVIELSPQDHDQLAQYAAPLAQELAQAQAEFIGEQGWMVYGDVIVEIERGDRLDTGMFRIFAEVYTGGDQPQAPPPADPYGGDVYGQPPQQDPYGQPLQQDPYGQPPQQAPYGQPPQQDPYGQPLQQDPYGQPQGGGYPVTAPPSQQDPYGQPPQQDPYGQPPQQDPYGQPAATQVSGYPGEYGQPSAPPAAAGGVYGGGATTAPVPEMPGPGGYEQNTYRQQDGYGQHGAPAPSGGGAHVITADGKNFPIGQGSTVIGRGEAAQIRLADVGISRQHIRLDFDGVRVVLTDLGSTNGTMVNGNRVNAVTLQHGDVLQLGTTTLTFRLD